MKKNIVVLIRHQFKLSFFCIKLFLKYMVVEGEKTHNDETCFLPIFL